MGFVANFIRFPAAQKFWKSVKIWQCYTQFKGGNYFWDTVYFSSTAAQNSRTSSSIFKDLPCFQALSRALNFKKQNSSNFKDFSSTD